MNFICSTYTVYILISNIFVPSVLYEFDRTRVTITIVEYLNPFKIIRTLSRLQLITVIYLRNFVYFNAKLNIFI